MRLCFGTDPVKVGRPMLPVERIALTSLRSMLITRIRPSIWVCTHRLLMSLRSDRDPISTIDTRHGGDLERADDGIGKRKELRDAHRRAVLRGCVLYAESTDAHRIERYHSSGLAESTFYPAIQYVIGSWYKPEELGKRACMFHVKLRLFLLATARLLDMCFIDCKRARTYVQRLPADSASNDNKSLRSLTIVPGRIQRP